MSAAVIKGALLQLDKERKAIAQEIELAREQLGPVGLSEPLVDAEGFPRADVDLLLVRTLRQRLTMLLNDYKGKDREADALLQQLHALGPAAFIAAPSMPATAAVADTGAASAAAASTAPAGVSPAAATTSRPGLSASTATRVAPPAPLPAAAYAPFALVDEVLLGSPAAEAGFLVGDRIAAIGAVVSLSAAGGAAGSGAGAGAGGLPSAGAGSAASDAAPGAGAGSAGAAGSAAPRPGLVDLAAQVRGSVGLPLSVVVLRGSSAASGAAAAGVGAGAGAAAASAGAGGPEPSGAGSRAGGAAAAVLLTLTPHTWAGQGLLGCHVVPLVAL